MSAPYVSASAPTATAFVSTGSLDEEVSRRIELCRVIGIFLIVIHHITPLNAGQFGDWADYGPMRGYVQFGLTKAATGLLSMISGYLLWSKPFEARPLKHFKGKARTLLIPMLICNVAIAGLLAVLESLGLPHKEKFAGLASGEWRVWLDAVLGVAEYPANQALHFIRDLLVCNVLAMVLAPLFRRAPWIVFLLSSWVVLLDLDGLLIQRDDIFILFMLGGIFGHLRLPTQPLDRFALPLTLTWLAWAAYVFSTQAYVYVADDMVNATVQLANRVLAAIAVWTLTARLASSSWGERISQYARYAFFVFLVHMPVDFLLFNVWMRAFGRESYMLYWFSSAFIVTAIAIVLFHAMRRFAPTPLGVLTGGRIVRK